MLRKAALAVAGLLLLAVLAAPLLLKLLFPPEVVRAKVVAAAEKGLHRQVRLGGVSLGLVHGLTLEDLAVSESPDFNAGTFAAVKSFSLRVKLLPLLRKKLIVDSVSAAGLTLRVVKQRDGRYNFSDLLAGSAERGAPAKPSSPASPAGPAAAPRPAPAAPIPAAGAPGGAAAPVAVAISDLRLEGASLTYEDQGAARTLALSNVNARLSGFSLSGRFSAGLSGSARGVWDGRPVDGSASFDGALDLGGRDPSKVSVDAKSLEVSAGGWSARLSGSAKDLSKPALNVSFKLSGPPGAVASGDFKGTLTLPAEKAALAAQGSLSLKTAALKPAEAAVLGLPAGMPLPAVSGSADFDYGGDALSLSRLEAQTPWGPLKAKGRIAALSSPKRAVDLDLDADLKLPAVRAADAPWLRLPRGSALPPLSVTGKAHVKNDALTTPGLIVRGAFGFLQVSGSARAPARPGARPEADLALSAKLDLPELRAGDLPWASLPSRFVLPPMEVVGEGRYKGDDLSLSSLRVKGRSGAIELSGSVRKLTSGEPEPDLDVTAKLSLPPLKSSDDPFGKVPPGLSLPSSSWDGSFTASRDEVKIRSLRVTVGRNDFSIDDGRVTGMRSGAPFVNMVVKCRRFQLEDITSLSQPLKELDLKGGGYFALGATGRLPRPVLEGKAQFQNVGADVQGLKLSGFSGTASFNETRIDVPNLRGKVADGDLDLNVTIKNYAKAPDIEVESSLSRFDLGQFLAAKQALAAQAAQKQAARQEQAAAAAAARGRPAPAPAAPAPAPPISTRGKFTVGELTHPNFTARNIRVDWDLTGVAADTRKLNGTAKVTTSDGRFTDLDALGKQSKIMKVLSLPLTVIKTVFLAVNHVDLNNPRYSDFSGDYAFSNGVMDIRDSRGVVENRDIDMKGQADLPNDRLDLAVTAEVGPKLPPVEVAVTGTLEDPKPKVKVGKMLEQGAVNLLQNILRR